MAALACVLDPERFPLHSDPCAVVVGVIGHQPERLRAHDPADPLRYWLRERIGRELLALGATLVWSGGAQGADEDGCRVAIQLGIPFCLALPWPGYDRRWTSEARTRAHKIRSQARGVEYISKRSPPTDRAARRFYLNRDVAIVRRVEHLIAVWDGGPGETADTVSLAASAGRSWTQIDPREFRPAHVPN